jgi:dTDP-4-amino-4,6-dideoxygalactose transaminase
METAGDILFRTILDELGTRTYRLPHNHVVGLQTRRVPIGRGPKGRYWQFEMEGVDGGGMIITDDEAFARRARYLTTQAKDDPVEYVHHEIGYNYRLTNLQAAVGVAQLERLHGHVEAKRRIARAYASALDGVSGLDVMREATWARSAFWMYTVLVHARMCGVTSRRLLALLGEAGIQTRPLWQPLHQSPAHRGAYAVDCSVAERLHRQALSLPCSVGLSSDAQTMVVTALAAACQRRTAARPRRKARHGQRPIATVSCG